LYWSYYFEFTIPVVTYTLNLPATWNLNPSDIKVPNQPSQVNVQINSGSLVQVKNAMSITANSYYFVNVTFPQRIGGCTNPDNGLSKENTITVSVVTIVVPLLIISAVIVIIIIAARCYIVRIRKQQQANEPDLVNVNIQSPQHVPSTYAEEKPHVNRQESTSSLNKDFKF
jgi:hypothetical protein